MVPRATGAFSLSLSTSHKEILLFVSACCLPIRLAPSVFLSTVFSFFITRFLIVTGTGLLLRTSKMVVVRRRRTRRRCHAQLRDCVIQAELRLEEWKIP